MIFIILFLINNNKKDTLLMYLCTNITSKVILHTDTRPSKKRQKTTVNFSDL